MTSTLFTFSKAILCIVVLLAIIIYQTYIVMYSHYVVNLYLDNEYQIINYNETKISINIINLPSNIYNTTTQIWAVNLSSLILNIGALFGSLVFMILESEPVRRIKLTNGIISIACFITSMCNSYHIYFYLNLPKQDVDFWNHYIDDRFMEIYQLIILLVLIHIWNTILILL